MDKFANASRSVYLVDLNAMVHRYFNAMGKVTLTANVMLDGVPTQINTSVVSSVIKAITRLSSDGINVVVVIADRAIKTRKAFFEYYTGTGEIGSARSGYKGTRDSMNYRIANDLKIITNMLEKAGCNVLYKDDYEADDIMPVVIEVSKIQYPDSPIHIIANDLDLMPLVDEQVTMYRRTKKLAFAEKGYPVLTNMYQTTVNNYQTEMEATSMFRGLPVPYNTVLLAKLLRGDKSDNIRHIDKLTPTKYRGIVEDMAFRSDIPENLFTYHPWKLRFIDKSSGNMYEKFKDVPSSVVLAGNAHIDLKEPEEVTTMLNVLSDYLTPEEVKEVHLRYTGMNLNGAILKVPGTSYRRRPYILPDDYKLIPFPKYELSKVVAVLQINIANV